MKLNATAPNTVSVSVSSPYLYVCMARVNLFSWSCMWLLDCVTWAALVHNTTNLCQTQPDLNTDSRACFILCFSFQNFKSWDFIQIIWCWNLSCLNGINAKISLEWSFQIVEFRVDVWVYRVLVFRRSVTSKNDKFITPTLTHHKCKNDTSKWFLLVMIHFVIGMPLMMNTSIYVIYFLFYHSQ